MRALLYAGALSSPRAFQCHIMLTLVDTAAALLATITARAMAGGLFDTTLDPHLDVLGSSRRRTVVTFYPDGSRTYTLHLRLRAFNKDARATVQAPIGNDMPHYLPTARTSGRFVFVLESFKDDGEPACQELGNMFDSCVLR